MTARKLTFGFIIAVLGIIVLLSWVAWNKGNLTWPYILGMGASVLILVVIWFWPAQERFGPPP